MLQMVAIHLLAPSVLLVVARGLYITAVHRIAAVQVVARQVMLVLVARVMPVAIVLLRDTLARPTVAVGKVQAAAGLAA